MQEKTIQTKVCKQCNSNFDITDKDLEFYDKISPVFSGEKFSIPSPTLCPDCRQQRRLSFRNERKLYKRKCDLTWKNIISMYSPDKNFKVYDYKEWWSDKWDAMDYWIDFDFEKWFFEQFWKLDKLVPKSNLFVSNSENCEYTNLLKYSNNCYYAIAGSQNEDCYHSTFIMGCSNVLDSLFIFNSENCYENVDCYTSFNLFFSQSSKDCRDSYFLYNCEWCENCFWSINLKNKKYYIYNKKYSKDEYFKKLNEILKEDWYINKNIKKLNDIKLKSTHKNYNWVQNDKITWDYISFSKDTFNSYDCTYLENCKYCTWLHKSEDCYDHYAWWIWWKLWYENHLCWNWFHNLLFSNCCEDNCTNLYYSQHCQSVNNCFWCVWLKNKEYCILNKQYTKEEYEKLVPKIIKHMQLPHPNPLLRGEGETTSEWWEFFPSSISPFWYNETVAYEYFPLTKQESQDCWFNWSDYITPIPKVSKIIPADKLPDNISDIPDDILNWAIECEVTKKPFRIIKQELEFYRKHNLPIPKRHPDQRHLDRMALRNPRKLYDRKCDKCSVDMKTTYSSDREEIVYCEECYNMEVY